MSPGSAWWCLSFLVANNAATGHAPSSSHQQSWFQGMRIPSPLVNIYVYVYKLLLLSAFVRDSVITEIQRRTKQLRKSCGRRATGMWDPRKGWDECCSAPPSRMKTSFLEGAQNLGRLWGTNPYCRGICVPMSNAPPFATTTNRSASCPSTDN